MAASQRKAGAILSYVSLVVNAVASFVYVPLLLRFLTVSEYGVYELIGSVIAYLSVMDMGLCTTLSRFYVKARVSQDGAAVENLLAMAVFAYGVITVIAVLIGLGLNGLLGGVLGASFTAEELTLAHRMMGLVIVNCAVALPGNWFLALINASERFVFARALSIAKYVLQILVVLAVLSRHSGALAVLMVQVACNAAAVVVSAIYVARRLRVRVRFHCWDGRLAASMFAFSGFVLLNMVFDQVFWKTGQVVLGAVRGSQDVAIYGIACKVITAGYMQVSTGVTSVFLPLLTELSARGKGALDAINELFCRIGRIQAYLVWGMLGGFAVLGRMFVGLWAGTDFISAYPAVLVLMAGLSVALVQNLGLSVLQAMNKMGFRATVYTVLAVLDVALSVPSAAHFGVMGVAVVAAVLLLVGTGPIMNAYYHRAIGIDMRAFWRGVLPVTMPAAIASVLTLLIAWLVVPGEGWLELAGLGAAYVAVYFIVAWRFTMNEYEKSLLARIPHRLRGLRR